MVPSSRKRPERGRLGPLPGVRLVAAIRLEGLVPKARRPPTRYFGAAAASETRSTACARFTPSATTSA
jgi:hypothetical protein